MYTIWLSLALTAAPNVQDRQPQPLACRSCAEAALAEAARIEYLRKNPGCSFPNPTEHAAFLSRAESRMLDFRREHGRFASDWRELHMSFVGGAGEYRLDDPRQYPGRGEGIRWRPLRSANTYCLTKVSDEGFVIEIFDKDGVKAHRVVKSYPRTGLKAMTR